MRSDMLARVIRARSSRPFRPPAFCQLPPHGQRRASLALRRAQSHNIQDSQQGVKSRKTKTRTPLPTLPALPALPSLRMQAIQAFVSMLALPLLRTQAIQAFVSMLVIRCP